MPTKNITDQEVIRACRDAHDDGSEEQGQFALTLLLERTGQPTKVCLHAMGRAADRGLIGYGVSLRSAWPTDKGRSVLAE